MGGVLASSTQTTETEEIVKESGKGLKLLVVIGGRGSQHPGHLGEKRSF